jgi:hypothetical protein
MPRGGDKLFDHPAGRGEAKFGEDGLVGLGVVGEKRGCGEQDSRQSSRS